MKRYSFKLISACALALLFSVAANPQLRAGQNSVPPGAMNQRAELRVSFDADNIQSETSVNTGKTGFNAFYGEGLKGRGLYLGTKPAGESTALASAPRFSAKGLFSKGASIMFWIKPDFDYWAPKDKKLGDLLSVLDSKGKPVISIGIIPWAIICSVKDKYTDSLFSVENRAVDLLYRDEWHHIALVVDPNGLSKIFIDGMLYSPSDIGLGGDKTRRTVKLNAADLSDADTIILGNTNNAPRDCALDEVSVLSRSV